jgi:hypothetical protein
MLSGSDTAAGYPGHGDDRQLLTPPTTEAMTAELATLGYHGIQRPAHLGRPGSAFFANSPADNREGRQSWHCCRYDQVFFTNFLSH